MEPDANDGRSEKTFVLPETVQFGFHPVCSHQMRVSEDGASAEKKDPVSYYAHGVVYGGKPLRGTAEFEVEIVSYGTAWSGTLKLGVMRCEAGSEMLAKNIPRYSPEGSGHCVWSSDKAHNRLPGHTGSSERHYGYVNLDDLREGHRLGMRLSRDGVLVFFVNGRCQGVAAERVHSKGYEVYPVVDHYANCKATRITRAGELNSTQARVISRTMPQCITRCLLDLLTAPMASPRCGLLVMENDNSRLQSGLGLNGFWKCVRLWYS